MNFAVRDLSSPIRETETWLAKHGSVFPVNLPGSVVHLRCTGLHNVPARILIQINDATKQLVIPASIAQQGYQLPTELRFTMGDHIFVKVDEIVTQGAMAIRRASSRQHEVRLDIRFNSVQ